ncbi:hypothetical protein EN932_27080 [Mesorhizobium sp. M7A.F.Ca.US.002.01.1.1]|uniref:hypothetical protein n=1 Tax=Mesorhizobium sp. M7A.F.Ca.US.002.01.1.1 TaxID=2496700 RepID=UPI000FD55562|nr:hypothetical protein [Mesorhizobium sp. M7A.F.Ca.US.002.01.1.1]RVA07640.1 hypothetical protein EN932_27080 [Mesorhizobium sp. M7A.F.Ca.US.002.01.1.1]
MTKSYQARPAGRHVIDRATGKLVRDGDFTNPEAPAKPAASPSRAPAVKPADDTGAGHPAGKGK